MSEDAAALTELLRRLGAPDPEAWATSEVEEGIAQTARFVALRNLWPSAIEPWRDPEVLARVPATRALLDAGAEPAAVSAAMCLAAYEAVFDTLWELTAGVEVPEGAPSVALMEVDAAGNLTGRSVDGLHESLLSLDPTGQEGADFLRA